jgi:hypothetical protein
MNGMAAAPPPRGGSAGEEEARRQLPEQQAETELSRINRELKRLKPQIAALAGTTGLEPATSDVTGLGSGLVISMIYLCFQ